MCVWINFQVPRKINNNISMECRNTRSDCDKTNTRGSYPDCMVDLSSDEISVKICFTSKKNDILLKLPVLDYEIASANNLKINHSPKLMDQFMSPFFTKKS